jgi:S1-C subfamily serine protease
MNEAAKTKAFATISSWSHKLAGVLLLMYLALAPASAMTTETIVAHAMPAVAILLMSDSTGKQYGEATGFFVNDHGLLLTNDHVIKHAARIDAYTLAKTYIGTGKVVATDKGVDLATVQFDNVHTAWLPLGMSGGVRAGASVIVIGNPRGLFGTVSTGVVSARRDVELQITAPISEGSSGSPVCDENGFVIGVAKSGLKDAQNINFAVPINMAYMAFSQLDPSSSWDKRPLTKADIEDIENKPKSSVSPDEKKPSSPARFGFEQDIHYVFPSATVIYATATEAKVKLGDDQASALLH